MAWTEDPLCRVTIFSTGFSQAENESRVIALMQDVLPLVTRENLSKPWAEIVVVANDRTGNRAKAALALWDQRRPVLGRLAPLAPGFPRLARSDEFKGLPVGEHFLLAAICPSGVGRELTEILPLVFPPENFGAKTSLADMPKTYKVPSDGLTVNCPRLSGTGHLDSKTSWGEWQRPDGKRVQIGYVSNPEAPAGAAFVRVAVILYDEKLNVLDSLTFDETSPPELHGVAGQFAAPAHRRTGECQMRCGNPDETMFFVSSCDVAWSDTKCLDKPDRILKTRDFDVTPDNKLKMTVTSTELKGNDCRPLE